MGLRYVWEKCNIEKVMGIKEESATSLSWNRLWTNVEQYPVISPGSLNVAYSYAYGPNIELHAGSTVAKSYMSLSGGNTFGGTLSDHFSPSSMPANTYIAFVSGNGSTDCYGQNKYAVFFKSSSSWTAFSDRFYDSYSGNWLYTLELQSAPAGLKKYTVAKVDGKGSTSYGNVSSASSGAYPTDGKSGSYWFVSKGNDTIDPASVTYPASPNGGELVDITIAPSTGIKFGGTVKYKVEYQLDGGSWQTAVESTTSTTVSVLIPKGTNTFAARATASDDTGFTSTTAVTGATVNVVNNAAPVINCGTSSLGEIAEPFSVTYSVSDEDADTMTITEKIDGTTIRSYSAPSGSSGEQTFNPSALQWLITLNGSHTATITADDGKGGVTTHSISFTRAVYTMSVTLEEPMETDDAITKCVVNIVRNLPADAEWSLLVTNNAFDPDPVWEDITQYVKNGWSCVFENQTVTSGRYVFNFKLTCTRGASGQGGSVDTISGGFE